MTNISYFLISWYKNNNYGKYNIFILNEMEKNVFKIEI